MKLSMDRRSELVRAAFHLFLTTASSPPTSEEVVLDFASFLFHKKGLASATISVPMLALKGPLLYSFKIVAAGFFNRCLPAHPQLPFLVMCRVLTRLQSPVFGKTASLECLFYKSLLFLALATGLIASHLHVLTRSSSWTSFASEFSSVSFAPSPSFPTKNEREDHGLAPVVIASWSVDSRPSSCSVTAL